MVELNFVCIVSLFEEEGVLGGLCRKKRLVWGYKEVVVCKLGRRV